MPHYYGVMIHPNGDPAIGAFGGNIPQHLPIPNRPSDFPAFSLPFAEEVRVDLISRLIFPWVEYTQKIGLVRVNDNGTADAWLLDDPGDNPPAAGNLPQ